MEWALVPLLNSTIPQREPPGRVEFGLAIRVPATQAEQLRSHLRASGPVTAWEYVEHCDRWVLVCIVFPGGWLERLLPDLRWKDRDCWVSELCYASPETVGTAAEFLRTLMVHPPPPGQPPGGIGTLLRVMAREGHFQGITHAVHAPNGPKLLWPAEAGRAPLVFARLAVQAQHIAKAALEWPGVGGSEASSAGDGFGLLAEALQAWRAGCHRCVLSQARAGSPWTVRRNLFSPLPEAQGPDALCAFPETARLCRGLYPLPDTRQGQEAPSRIVLDTSDSLILHLAERDPGFVRWAAWTLSMGTGDHLLRQRGLLYRQVPAYPEGRYVPMAVLTISHQAGDEAPVLTVGRWGRRWAVGVMAPSYASQAQVPFKELALAEPEGPVGVLLWDRHGAGIVQATRHRSERLRNWLFYSYVLADVLDSCGMFAHAISCLEQAGLSQSGAYVLLPDQLRADLAERLGWARTPQCPPFPICTPRKLDSQQRRDPGVVDGIGEGGSVSWPIPWGWSWLVHTFLPHSPRLRALVGSIRHFASERG